MPDIWMPGFEIVKLGNAVSGGAYDTWLNPKGLLHTTEGGSIAGARKAYAPYPPHMVYDRRTRQGEQYVPLNKHSYSLNKSESDDEFVIQVELVGYAGQAHTWTDEELWNIGQDVIRPLREIVGIPDIIVPSGFLSEADANRKGIVLARATSPIRLSDTQLRNFSGWMGHQHAPNPDNHWDPGGLKVNKCIEYSHEGDDMKVDDITDGVLSRISDRLVTDMYGKRFNDVTVIGMLQNTATHAAYTRGVVDGLRGQILQGVQSIVEADENTVLTVTDDQLNTIIAGLRAGLPQGVTQEQVLAAVRVAFADAGSDE